MDPYICTIGFTADCHESAAHHYQQMLGWVGTVTLASGEQFDGTIMNLFVGEEDGQYKVVIAKWNEEAQKGDPNDRVTLDIYEDIDTIVVF